MSTEYLFVLKLAVSVKRLKSGIKLTVVVVVD